MRGVQPAFGVTCVHLAPSREDHTAELAEWPGKPPVIPTAHHPHLVVEGKRHGQIAGAESRGADFVTSVHVFPSADAHIAWRSRKS